jgi:integrase
VPQANLTDAFIRNLKSHEKQTLYTDTNLRGFGLRCSGDVRTFIVVPPNDRSRRKITIGRYGPGGWTLQRARQHAAALLSEIVLGIHKPKTLTVAEAFEIYRATHLQTLREGSRRESERLIRRALPKFGRSEIGKITTPELAAFIARDRIFSPQELRSVLSTAFLEGNYNRLIAMSLCSGQRWGQIVALREHHIDRQTRTLSWSGAEMKTRAAFTFPYHDLVASLIEEL